MAFDRSKSSVVRNLTSQFEKMGKDMGAELRGIGDRAADLTGYVNQKAVDLSVIAANIEMAKQMKSKCALLVHWLQLLLGNNSDSRKSIGTTENDAFSRYSELPRGIDQILHDDEFTFDSSKTIDAYLTLLVIKNAIEDKLGKSGSDLNKETCDAVKKTISPTKITVKSGLGGPGKTFSTTAKQSAAKAEAVEAIKAIVKENDAQKTRDKKIKSLEDDISSKQRDVNDSGTASSDYETFRKKLDDELHKAVDYVSKFKECIGPSGYATMAIRRAEGLERDVSSGKKKSGKAAKESDDAFRLANNQSKKDLEDFRRVCVPLIDALIYFHRFMDKKARVQPIDDTIADLIASIRQNYPKGPYKEAIDQKQKIQLEAERKYKGVMDEMQSSRLFKQMKESADAASK